MSRVNTKFELFFSILDARGDLSSSSVIERLFYDYFFYVIHSLLIM